MRLCARTICGSPHHLSRRGSRLDAHGGKGVGPPLTRRRLLLRVRALRKVARHARRPGRIRPGSRRLAAAGSARRSRRTAPGTGCNCHSPGHPMMAGPNAYTAATTSHAWKKRSPITMASCSNDAHRSQLTWKGTSAEACRRLRRSRMRVGPRMRNRHYLPSKARPLRLAPRFMASMAAAIPRWAS